MGCPTGPGEALGVGFCPGLGVGRLQSGFWQHGLLGSNTIRQWYGRLGKCGHL